MTETLAIRVPDPGPKAALSVDRIPLPDPAPGEVRLRHTAIGLNYIDIYFRTGTYPAPTSPFTLGLEAAGVVEALGDGVKGVEVGSRVAYAGAPLGAYAERRNFPADRLVMVPEQVADEQAAALMLKGMTAHYLLHGVYPVQAGETILVHAAAGGVGLLLCQWAKHLGATIIGTVGSKEKADLAKQHGCDHPVFYQSKNWPEQVRDITENKGVAVVYDSVGQATFAGSLQCLKKRGMMALFGQSSGKVPPFDLGELAARGSLFITRPSLFDYIADRQSLLERAEAMFEQVSKGVLSVQINQRYPLRDAEKAHTDLVGRKTTGASVFLVDNE